MAADQVEVRISVKAKAKAPGDALRNFKAKKALFQKAVGVFEGVVVEGGGVRVGVEQSSNQAFMFDGQAPAEPGFEVAEIMTLRLAASGTDIQTVVELIDEAQDVGCQLAGGSSDALQAFYLAQAGSPTGGGPGAIRYRPTDSALAKAKEQAMELAFRDARAQAETAAQVAGVKVGPVQAIRIMKSFDGASGQAGAGSGSIRISVRFGIL